MMYGGRSSGSTCVFVYNVDNGEEAMKIAQEYGQQRFHFKCL